MSEETAKIDKVLQAFLEETTKVLRQHKEAVTRLTAVVEQVIQNSKIEHENVRQLTEQTNCHTALLQALDKAVRLRMGEPPLEPPREPVN
jgi:hypothetical protein